jgi:RNA polymerase sigma factor for flagellar operon FliA
MVLTKSDPKWLQKSAGDTKARNAIINHYLYLVKITAGRVVSNLPASLEREDLVSAGTVGLIKAVDQFDTNRQVKFETYAIALIRGAILEMLREEDWVPRSVREKVKALERAMPQLEMALGRPPTEDELARHLGIPLEDYLRLLVDANRTVQISMDDVLVGGDGSEGMSISDLLKDENAVPSGEVELRERKRFLAAAIDRLPERERLVISLYYYDGLTFKEIGKILSISESRVYQLHTQAVVRLRTYLQPDKLLFQ